MVESSPWVATLLGEMQDSALCPEGPVHTGTLDCLCHHVSQHVPTSFVAIPLLGHGHTRFWDGDVSPPVFAPAAPAGCRAWPWLPFPGAQLCVLCKDRSACCAQSRGTPACATVLAAHTGDSQEGRE